MLISTRVRLRSGWSGGQYSLCRVLLGILLAAHLLRLLPGATWGIRILLAAAVAGTLLLAVGWRDRAAAILVLIVLGLVTVTPALAGVAPAPLDARVLVWPWFLMAHLLVPAAPYGSMAARGRVDPRGDWDMPAWMPWVHRAAFVLLVLRVLGRGAGTADVVAVGLLGLLSFDPGWIAPAGRRAKARGADKHPETLFYDGTCGLCHGAVRFLLAEDRFARFRFAPLQSRAFRTALPKDERDALPDSLVLKTREGTILTRARAVRHLLASIGGSWRLIAAIARIVPLPLADAAYDAVARVRHRLFRRPDDACPLTPPDLRARFLPG
ncbi:MAG TPA: DCC1-like thiol-disulfide oxidoreductase family protein [Candidatus Polarisedimenticolia bacterium]|nr:DCC1-like thiol-disulfide oxidoreductase family protein [Candidatus Polarisedimenticolia bacterium]